MNKNELKNEDIVTLRNGEKLIYIDEGFIDYSNKNINALSNIDDITDDLIFKGDMGFNNNYDIVYVMRPVKYADIFDRRETKFITKEEIERELGYKIEIIKEEE